MEGDLIWTDELLRRLQGAGLEVTSNMLAQDVKAGYLPRPSVQSKSPIRGRAGQWGRIAQRRAFYLYRLRKRGAQGSLLRILLFLRDGWGWDRIQPICLAGLQKFIEAQRSQVKDHIYKPITPEILGTHVDDISEDAGIQHLEIGKFIFGMGIFGTPIEGGSLRPFWGLLEKYLAIRVPFSSEQFEQRMMNSALTWERMLHIVREANSEEAERARLIYLESVALFRRLICIDASYRETSALYRSNLLTLCGHNAKEIATDLRTTPKRITPGQLLATGLGLALVADYFDGTLSDGELQRHARTDFENSR